ncbi:MAG: galactokinase family protein [Bacillota bacterium]
MTTKIAPKELVARKSFLKTVQEIYTASPQEVAERYATLINIHTESYKGAYDMFSSPGRIELCGNHTDHNGGSVVAAAVSVDTIAVVTKIAENKIIIKSVGYPIVEVDITDHKHYSAEEGTSHALVRGVIDAFLARGYNVGGFIATTTSDVFKGAGMSSSASFEVLVTAILNYYYNDDKIDAVERAIISQYAENVYFGKPSGLMDQASISIGGVSYMNFKDNNAPIVKKLDWQFANCTAVVINCGGDHCDLTPEYASIKHEMQAIANHFGAEKLGYIAEEVFYSALAELKEKFSGRAIMRAMHFYSENERVHNFADGVIANDIDKVMGIVTESGDSSYQKLQNCYVSGDDAQPIPLGLALVAEEDGVLARRVHGGGFAGTILTFVDNAYLANFVENMAKYYGKQNVFAVKIRANGSYKIEI